MTGARERSGRARVRRGHSYAIGTRHSGLIVGNAAERDEKYHTGWHSPCGGHPGSPTRLPARTSSCSLPCSQEPQLPMGRRGRGGVCRKLTLRNPPENGLP